VWWPNDNGLPRGEVISDTSEYMKVQELLSESSRDVIYYPQGSSRDVIYYPQGSSRDVIYYPQGSSRDVIYYPQS
jgi:hypothetical protein